MRDSVSQTAPEIGCVVEKPETHRVLTPIFARPCNKVLNSRLCHYQDQIAKLVSKKSGFSLPVLSRLLYADLALLSVLLRMQYSD